MYWEERPMLQEICWDWVARRMSSACFGNDHNGNTMQEMFADLGIRNELFHTEHPTITKTRVIGNSQQVVRLDFETENECLNEETEQKLLDAVKRAPRSGHCRDFGLWQGSMQ